jgi:hypothetical protein
MNVKEDFLTEEHTNEKLGKFAERVSETYKDVKPKHVKFMIYLDAKDNYEFDNQKLTPKQYIEKSVEYANQWLNLDRRSLNPLDLYHYGIAYLFFTSLEKK